MRTLFPLVMMFPAAAWAGPTAKEMQTHWTMATGARDGVVKGDLDAARLWGWTLTELAPPKSLTDGTRPLYAEMQEAAKKLSDAPDLATAGARVGALALTCAECHDFTGGGPGHLIVPLPDQDFGGAPTDMALHEWANDWLWIGLVANDSAAWKRGADALLRAPFKTFGGVPNQADNRDEHVVHLVPSLAEVGDRAAQAERYGRLITACADCHTDAKETGRGPTP